MTKPITETYEVLPFRFIPLQVKNGKVTHACCADENSTHYLYLMCRTSYGVWIPLRKLEKWEIMQVEDQEYYGIILETKD